MNPPAFQAQLETAIENRDDIALTELERIAADNPETQIMWQDHLLIENAIKDWQLISNRTHPLNTTPRQTPVPLHQRLLAATTAAVLLISAASYFHSPVPQESNSLTATSQSAAVIEESFQHEVAANYDQFLVRNESASAFPSNTAGFQDLYLPVSVVSQVHSQLSEEFSQAWNLISRLPNDAEQVYEKFEDIVPKSSPAEKPAPEETEEQDFLPASIRSLLS